MARSPDEGLRNEALRAALPEALAGRSERLEELLARHGMLPSMRPNLTLAAAFGAELASMQGRVAKLLAHLSREDAAPDTPRAFLPVAAAHGWTARLVDRHDEAEAWHWLAELAADERAPVRLGTLDALTQLAARPERADDFVAHAAEWLELEDREIQFGATALALEAVADPRVLAGVEDIEALLAYLSGAIAAVADAPRSAERSDGRRRLVLSLPKAAAVVVSTLRAGDRGLQWFVAECEGAEHPDVRKALSKAIEHLRTSGRAQGTQAVDIARKTLEGSAKPLRDPTRVRPGTGRGKHSRRTR